jgi:hypothetical protein
MFHIREAHLEGLAVQQADGFMGRMAGHLREIFPAELEHFDQEQLDAIVRKGLAAAEGWGIREEQQTERLLELLVAFPQLRCDPLPGWVAEIVGYPGRSGEHKLIRLEDRLLFGPGV